MLASSKLVGFLFTTDYDCAREFYVGRLGFEFVELSPFALVLKLGGHTFRISKIPNFTPAQGTVLGWEVTDIVAVVQWLAGRGVVTEKYPFVEDQATGIWVSPDGAKVAWFKDPDGNVLSVNVNSPGA